MKESLSEKQRAARYLAVLIDRDSHFSNTDCEIVCVWLLERGKPENFLIGQQTLQHSRTHDMKVVCVFKPNLVLV